MQAAQRFDFRKTTREYTKTAAGNADDDDDDDDDRDVMMEWFKH